MFGKRKISMDFSYNYPQIAKDCGFKFRYYKDGPLDWRLIGSLEVERILNEQNFEQIDGSLSHISEVPLASMLDSNILDSGIAKYFILSQFSVQYLLFCRKFLEETVTELREYHGSSQMEIATLKKSLSEANTEILQLHKKITQMEAIHEVIYPCHMCTKNFVSNDALNLHISRKHNGNFGKQDKKSEISASVVKDRENDLALINTIKLELEIKQLKERLNNTEREIKEKNMDSSNVLAIKNSATATPQASVHSIGIQSNLSEIKERDDKSEDDLSTTSENRQQLCMLLEKLQDFERWKEEQKLQNSEFLTEMNKKIKEFSAAVEQRKNNVSNDEKVQTPSSTSVSLENLETLLSKRIEDIGKTNAAKLDEIVTKIEKSYKDKLEMLETELKIMYEKNKLPKDTSIREDIKLSNRQKKLEKPNDNTFEIVTSKNLENVNGSIKSISDNQNEKQKDLMPQEESSKSNSNHTFVKTNNVSGQEDDEKSISSQSSEDDSTDISESIFEEERNKKTKRQSTNSHSNKSQDIKETSSILKMTTTKKPKIVTKSDAKKLTNARLLSLGLNTKTKSLTPALRKRILLDLSENRNKLKQKYPHFYATRNKIKKLVDKLCSTKMPENAENLLRVTKSYRSLNLQVDIQNNEDSSSENEIEINSIDTSRSQHTNISRNKSIEFKQRLERILASPIKKPEEHTVKAIVHDNNTMQKPVPMPRKRVIFNQPERHERHLNNSPNLSGTVSRTPYLEHHQK